MISRRATNLNTAIGPAAPPSSPQGLNAPAASISTISAKVSPWSSLAFTHRACSGAVNGQRADRPLAPP